MSDKDNESVTSDNTPEPPNEPPLPNSEILSPMQESVE
jgi:hypothetical protein